MIRLFPKNKLDKSVERKMSLPLKYKTNNILNASQLNKLVKNIDIVEKINIHNDKLNKCDTVDKIKLGKEIGKGQEGSVFIVENEENELNYKNVDLVIKKSTTMIESEFYRESFISLLLSKEVVNENTINFPLIYDVFTCKTGVKSTKYILMKKLEPFSEIIPSLSQKNRDIILFQLIASIYFMQKNLK